MPPTAPRKILVLELWGLGDLTFSTVLIRKAVEAGDSVHLLAKPHALMLLEPTFPTLKFFPFQAGWTKFIHKYWVWRWNWRVFFSLLRQLHREHYDVAVSARDDPRDHLLMWLIGARRRFGFAHTGSGVFLTDAVKRSGGPYQHRVEDWRDLAAAVGYAGTAETSPRLNHVAYRSVRIDQVLSGNRLPVVVLHTGARIAVRRWPLHFFEDLIARLRNTFSLYLILIPDPDGYGSELASLANAVLNDVTLTELVDVMGRASLVLCNDSGPGHLAAACNRPTVTLFGPTEARWFRPWGIWHHVIHRDICPHRPCFDYCRFSEPYCMTRLTPATIWPEVEAHFRRLAADLVIPSAIVPVNELPRPKPLVAVIVATYKRPVELARLLRSLEPTDIPLAVVVVDNADDPETSGVVAASGSKFDVVRIVPGRNLGCGGGLALGEKEALKRFGNQITHFWIMDDDAVAAPGALEKLLMALSDEEAFVACPMILDEEGRIGAFPGLLSRREFNAIRKQRVRTPVEYNERFGLGVVPFSWATGISLLVERGALEAIGFHREDFLVRGEDLDFSLRLTAWGKGVFVPDAHVQHLPPATGMSPNGLLAERHKHAILLQNIAYIGTRLVHGRRILRNLPGNYWRYFRIWRLGGLREALSAFWRGAIRGNPAGMRKVLVFAHTPPPHHGQSFMVKLMLDGFGGDRCSQPHSENCQVACYHVNCRLSEGMDDIGIMRAGKAWLLLWYCLQAVWYRVRHGVKIFYYIPAPGKCSPLYRDWIVMLLCRPFFPYLIFHWHATGLTHWLEQRGYAVKRWITRCLMKKPELSIVLAKASARDAEWLKSRRIMVVPNGIPDPCPDFELSLLCKRKARRGELLRQCEESRENGTLPAEFRLLYISHCTREKGVFDTLEGVALFNQRQKGVRVFLTVAGKFMNFEEEQEFNDRIAQPDLNGAVEYVGFALGNEKKRLFEMSDALCFPSYYPAESFGLVVVEAMACGLPLVATRWNAIPEILPKDYPGLVDPKSPEQIAATLGIIMKEDLTETLRSRFVTRFGLEPHIELLTKAIESFPS